MSRNQKQKYKALYKGKTSLKGNQDKSRKKKIKQNESD